MAINPLLRAFILAVVTLVLVTSGVSAAKQQEYTGIVDVIHVDDFDHPQNSHYDYYLRTPTKIYHLAPHPFLDPVLAGAKVTLRGAAKGDQLALTTESPGALVGSIQQATRRIPDNFGDQRTLGIVMSMNGAQPPATVERVRHELFDYAPGPINPTTSTAQTYYNSTSYGQVTFVGDVKGPYVFSATSCDPYPILQEGLRAASASVDVATYSRIVIVTSCSPCFCGGGLGTTGKLQNWALPDGRVVNISVAWEYSFNTIVVAHELGHNFGGNHASSSLCRDENQTWLQYGLNCEQYEYADAYDALGSGANEMNAIHRSEIGWLDKKYTKTIANDVTAQYVLTDLDLKPAGQQVHQVIFPVSRDTGKYTAMDNVYYSIEYRTNMYSIGGSRTGVGIRMFKKGPLWYAPESLFNMMQTTLVNPDAPREYLPQTPGGADGLLNAPGDAYTDDINGYRVTLLSLTSTTATVKVEHIPQRIFNFAQPIVKYTFERTTPGPYGRTMVPDVAGYAPPATAYNLGLLGTKSVPGNTIAYFGDSMNTTPDSAGSYLATGGFVPALVHDRQTSTMALWMRADPYVPAPGYPYDLNLVSVGNARIGMQLHAPNEGLFLENCFMVNADFSCITSRTPLPSAGQWHHIAATYDGTAQYLYVDGVLMASAPKPSGSAGLAFAPSPNINVGGNPWETTQYNGYMDDVTFWARALTQSDVKDLAAIPPR